MSRLRRRAAAIALAAGVAGLGAGCVGPRNALGTSATPCYRAIPVATAAVHAKGKLVGVRRIHTTTLRRRFPNDPRVAAATGTYVCNVAFRGEYRPGDVDLAESSQPGPYALVAVSSKSNELIAVFILQQLPGRFRHVR